MCQRQKILYLEGRGVRKGRPGQGEVTYDHSAYNFRELVHRIVGQPGIKTAERIEIRNCNKRTLTGVVFLI